jgi:hypothetical protein
VTIRWMDECRKDPQWHALHVCYLHNSDCSGVEANERLSRAMDFIHALSRIERWYESEFGR